MLVIFGGYLRFEPDSFFNFTVGLNFKQNDKNQAIS